MNQSKLRKNRYQIVHISIFLIGSKSERKYLTNEAKEHQYIDLQAPNVLQSLLIRKFKECTFIERR